MPHSLHDIRTKVTERELAAWRADFLHPHTPVALADKVAAFGELVGDHAVDSSRAMFWRDAYLAAQFGLLRRADRVQMLEPTRGEDGRVAPDFRIEIDGEWIRYESVEALPAHRRRSDEFREDRAAGGSVARRDHIPDQSELTAILADATAKKVEKAASYADCRGLVIMLSTWSLVPDQERAFTEGTAAAGAAFDEVWVIKHAIAHLVWSSGYAAYGWSNAR